MRFKIAKKELVMFIVNFSVLMLQTESCTKEELADKIGVSRSTILSIENKKREMTWNTFLSLILLFTKNETTNKLLNVLDIYTDEFHDFIKEK